MAKKNEHSYEFYCNEVEKFLAGERENPLISTTKAIAKRLEQRYHVKMSRFGTTSEKNGIYLFKIT